MSNLPYREEDHKLLCAALEFATRGWYVFRLKPFSKEPLACSHGLLDATIDPERIRRWWDEVPSANIGINCGMSHIVVVDVDPRNGGRISDLPNTWDNPMRFASTPSGGWHLYYPWPLELDVPRKRLYSPGIDLQGAGGYVVAPPSELLHGDYKWTPWI